jgi:hypothetical protein
LQRPWKADAVLTELLETFITGKNSIVQRIDNSLLLRNMFQKYVSEQESSGGCKGTISNLRSAKHRFESLSKPICRLVMFFPAMARTAAHMAADRTSRTEGSDAKDFLEAMTDARLVQLAMMADAADEALRLIRACDAERLAVGAAHLHAKDFLERIRGLFVDGLCMKTGFTKYMLELLEGGVVIFQGERGTWKWGGPGAVTDEVKRHALGHMQAWVRLAESVVAAEFPDFEVFLAFSVFEVSGNSDSSRTGDSGRPPLEQRTPAQKKMLAKLATLFDLDAGLLEAQFDSYVGIAGNICRSKGCSSREAWREALTLKGGTSAASNPRDALMVVVQRFCGWSCSTSGVEQHFSKAERAFRRRTTMSERSEADAMRFLDPQAIEPKDQAAYVRRCRELWLEYFGATRHRGANRRDKGVAKPSKTGSEAAWLRKRRQDVSAAIAAGSAEQQASATIQWSEQHEGELQYQLKKRRMRKVDAAIRGHLGTDELDEGLEAQIAERLDRDAKRDAELVRRHRRIIKKIRQADDVDWTELAGSKAYIRNLEPHMLRDEARQALADKGLVITEDRLEADVFVVEDVLVPGMRNKWCAALHGAMVISLRRLLQQTGPFLKYKRALRTQQEVWLSPAFRQAHPDIAGIIELASAGRGSRWKIVTGNNDAFAAAVQRRVRPRGSRRSNIVAGLITAAEQRHLHEELPQARLLCKGDLLDRIARTDLSKSRDDR